MISINYLSDCKWTIPVLAKELYSQWSSILTFEGQNEETVIWELFARATGDSLPLAFVAFIEGQPAGTVSLLPEDMEGGSLSRSIQIMTPWLADLFVIPEYRGRGIGSALIERIEAEAKSLGFDIIYLYTEDCINLYDSLGWIVLEKTRYAELNVTIMEKKLS